MSGNMMESYISKMQEWEELAEEARAEADAIRDLIKAEMAAQGKEEMAAGRFIVRWTPVLSNRFDTTAFKKAHGDLYQRYMKQVSSKRFSVAA